MEQSERLVLQRNRLYISKNMRAERVVDALFAESMIDEDDKDEILAKTTTRSKVCELLDILSRKGPQAFACFLRALSACGFGCLASYLQSKLTGELTIEEGGGEKPSSFGLGEKIAKFVGRNEDCGKLTSMLTSDEIGSSRVVNIVGPPGFGKTALAVMTAHKLLDLGKDVLYVSLKEVLTITRAAEKLLEIIGIPVGQKPVLRVTQYLASCQKQTVLILDNAEDLQYVDNSAFSGFLKEISEQAKNLVTLVTSRISLSSLDHYFFPTNFPLLPLTEEQSFLFLKTHAPNITDQEARHLSCHRVCGGVPLMLELTASFLEKN